MFKYLVSAIVLLGLVACGLNEPKPAHPDFERIIENTSVTLTKDNRDFCSGVVIGENEILTAGHCVDSQKFNQPFQVRVKGQTLLARVVYVDYPADLALLEVPGVKFTETVKLADEMPKLGDPVWCIGNPVGQMPDTLTQGVISYKGRTDVIQPNVAPPRTQITCTIHPGNSGGAALDNDGNLIGINVSMYIGASAYGVTQYGGQYVFSVSLKTIKEFLNENLSARPKVH